MPRKFKNPIASINAQPASFQTSPPGLHANRNGASTPKEFARSSASRMSRVDIVEAQNNSFGFDDLVGFLDPSPDPVPQLWERLVDRELQIVLFFQVDLKSRAPKMSKCVRIRCQNYWAGDVLQQKLIASVFLDQKSLCLPATPRPPLSFRPLINSLQEIVSLLERVELYPEYPEDTATEKERTVPRVEPKRKSSAEILVDGDTSFSGDETESGDDNYRPSVAQALSPRKGFHDKSFSLRDGIYRSDDGLERDSDTGLKLDKLVLLNKTKKSLTENIPGKVELFPGSQVFLDPALLKQMEAGRFKKASMTVRAKMSGAHYATSVTGKLLDSVGHLVQHLRPDKKAVKAALGQELIAEIMAFVNLNDPLVVQRRRPPVAENRFLWTFVQKMVYNRNKVLVSESKYMRQKQQVLLSGNAQGTKVKNARSSHSMPGRDSTGSVAESDEKKGSEENACHWDPAICFVPGHSEWCPWYLVPRDGYEPLYPVADKSRQVIYMNSEWAQYFATPKSHEDYPDASKWTRALLHKLLDENSLRHISYLYDQQRLSGIARSRLLVSPGFLEILDDYLRNVGKLGYDRDFVATTFGQWRKDRIKTLEKGRAKPLKRKSSMMTTTAEKTSERKECAQESGSEQSVSKQRRITRSSVRARKQ